MALMVQCDAKSTPNIDAHHHSVRGSTQKELKATHAPAGSSRLTKSRNFLCFDYPFGFLLTDPVATELFLFWLTLSRVDSVGKTMNEIYGRSTTGERVCTMYGT